MTCKFGGYENRRYENGYWSDEAGHIRNKGRVIRQYVEKRKPMANELVISFSDVDDHDNQHQHPHHENEGGQEFLDNIAV